MPHTEVCGSASYGKNATLPLTTHSLILGQRPLDAEWITWRTAYSFFGLPHNVEVAVYLTQVIMAVFDRAQVRAHRDRASSGFHGGHDFLLSEVGERLIVPGISEWADRF